MRLQYLEIFRHRGKAIAFYRRDGVRRRLRDLAGAPIDPTDTTALTAAWQAAHAAHEAADRAAAAAGEARAVTPRSIADLVLQYRASPGFEGLKPSTKLDYEKALKPLERDCGKLMAATIKAHHVTQLRDRYAWREEPDSAKPGQKIRVSNARQADRVVTMLSILLSYAVNPLGWRPDNPALRPKRLRREIESYQPWTPAQWQQFWQRATPEWRFAAALALLTAQRGQDQVAMTWQDYDGSRIRVVQEKGRKTVRLWVPAHPFLRPLLDARRAKAKRLDPSPATILYRPDGLPWQVNAFQKAAGKAIRAAGLDGVVWHGLRKTGLTWSAEGGASDAALQGLGGHKTRQMVGLYTAEANQQRLAQQAIDAIAMPVKNGRRTRSANHGDKKVPTIPAKTG